MRRRTASPAGEADLVWPGELPRHGGRAQVMIFTKRSRGAISLSYCDKMFLTFCFKEIIHPIKTARHESQKKGLADFQNKMP